MKIIIFCIISQIIILQRNIFVINHSVKNNLGSDYFASNHFVKLLFQLFSKWLFCKFINNKIFFCKIVIFIIFTLMNSKNAFSQNYYFDYFSIRLIAKCSFANIFILFICEIIICNMFIYKTIICKYWQLKKTNWCDNYLLITN